MRILVPLLWVATILLFGCRDSPPPSTNVPLSFYIVSAENIAGGRFIDTPDFPKLGYIPAVPELVLTKLEAVIVDRNGKETVEPMKNLHIRMLADDATKFTALTEQAVGKHMLLMLGDTPLIAARIMTPIATQSLQLTFREKSDMKKIVDALRRLTK
jgi:hypothetical protein